MKNETLIRADYQVMNDGPGQTQRRVILRQALDK